MTSKTASSSVGTFLAREGASALSKVEAHKLADFSVEKIGNHNSMLGWIFVQFKKMLQEETILKGLKSLFKGHISGESKHQYDAFSHEFKIFDDLSNYYGNQYRGSFIFIYLMGALAVLIALIPVGFSFEYHFGHDAHLYEFLFTGIELFVILTILIVNRIGTTPHERHIGNSFFGYKFNRRWHQRWIEYRILAERFRYMEILYPIGINPLIEGVAQKNDLNIWINAYYAMRLTQTATSSVEDKSAYKARLLAVMEGQSNYHLKNSHHAEHIHHRIHMLAIWLFYATLIACAAHFAWHDPILTLASGFFPAFSAAMHGILANGEFSKSVDVSERMHQQIEKMLKRLQATSAEQEIRDIAIDFHKIVIGEALSWRAMFKDKNVPLA